MMMISGRSRRRGYQPTADSRQLQTRSRRDPISKREALRRAKALFAQIEREPAGGSFETAAVLADVIAYTGNENLAEELALAVAGRATAIGATSVSQSARGDLVPPGWRQANLSHALMTVRRRLFPPRAKPCMPSRRELAQLVETGARHRGFRRPASVDLSQEIHRLWRLMRMTCNSNRGSHRALEAANELLDGHGVEHLSVQTRREGTLHADYVNTGETYDATLLYDHHANRFRVTSWGDLLETWERRYGRTDDDGDDW